MPGLDVSRARCEDAIKQISCGSNHTLAVSTKSKVLPGDMETMAVSDMGK